jgi:succinate dehydrogenase/fumarate reductase flavoprotein subunit
MATISHDVDVLVIGSGIAGQRAALAASRAGAKTLIVSFGGGGSPDIMGFSAPALEGDCAEVVYSDVNASGLGVNDPEFAKVFASGTEEIIPDLDAMHVSLEKDDSGRCRPLQALGTSFPRLVHHYMCLTGVEIQKALHRELKASGVTVRTGTMITDLLVDNGAVRGACGLDCSSGELLVIKSRAVVVTTGGSGRTHSFTTYPRDITGDGMAMAYRAGVPLVDMEFLQFEPCGFVTPDAIRGSLIPTTLLKAGGELRNAEGEVFISDYSMIQKDVLSRRIHKEIAEGRGTPAGGIYYDVTKLPGDLVKVTHFLFYDPAMKGGIDISKEPCQMAPSAHTFLGGAKVRPDCSTNIAGLYMAGEVLGGIHGGNRIGGDGGASALVFGKIAGRTVAAQFNDLEIAPGNVVLSLAESEKSQYASLSGKKGASPEEFKTAIQEIMQERVGLIKTRDGLDIADKKLAGLEHSFDDLGASNAKDVREAFSARNMLLTARMMLEASRCRKESRGAHYRADYPDRNDDAWTGKNVIIQKKPDRTMGIAVSQR